MYIGMSAEYILPLGIKNSFGSLIMYPMQEVKNF